MVASTATTIVPTPRLLPADWRNLAFIIVGFALVIPIIGISRDFPMRDECIYVAALADFRANLSYVPPDMTQTSLVGLIWLGWAWSLLFGFSFTSLTALMLAVSALGLVGFYLLLRELGTAANAALLGVALLGFNPFYLHLSYIYMTEIPFLCLTFYACLFYLWGLRGRGAGWLWLGGLLTAYNLLIRQYAALIIVALLGYMLLTRWDWRKLVAATLPVVAVGLAFLLWQRGQPLNTATLIQQSSSSFIFTLDWPRVVLGRGLAYLPLLGLFTWPLLRVRRRSLLLLWLGLAGLLLLLAARSTELAATLLHNTLDYDGNLLTRGGFDLFLYDDPPVLNGAIWDTLIVLGALLGAVLLAQISERLADWWQTQNGRERWTAHSFVYLLGLLITIVSYAFSGLSFDRYLLGFLPFLIVFVMQGSESWGRTAWAYLVAGVILLGGFALLLETDFDARAAAHWQAGQHVLAQGVRPQDVWVGFEWQYWYNMANEQSLPYKVDEQPDPNYHLIAEYPYYTRLGGFTTRNIGVWQRNKLLAHQRCWVKERVMQLAELMAASPSARLLDPTAVQCEVTSIVYDSREARPGSVFVARKEKGYHSDGHDYIPTAAANGAIAAVVSTEYAATHPDAPLALISSPDTGAALAEFAAAFYGYPARKLRVVGVTGTDGKTTTTFLISKVLEGGGHHTGLFGTVSFKVGPRIWDNPTRATTPEATEVQALMAEMVADGCDYAVLESSSHGLAQHRLDHCEYDVAVLTNVTHEHLEFHGTVEQYRRDKARLFDFLGTSADKGVPKVGVVNLDDPNAAMYIERVPKGGQMLTYAVTNEHADVRAVNISSQASGLSYTAVTPAGNVDLNLMLTGSFNVYNSLAALAVGISQGISLANIKTALESVPGVAGRMEQIKLWQDFTCIVDYAHTPDAMDKVLGILRPLSSGKLIAVFGSAGERDLAKRPMQGAVAAKWCDFFVIADEDPRFEPPMKIINEIAAGAEAAGKVAGHDFLKIADRRAAIAAAFDHAAAGDIVVLLGKGHEQCIIVGNDKLPWDDRTVAAELLRERQAEC